MNERFHVPGLELVCLVLCSALIYAASFGPVHGLMLRGGLPPQALIAFKAFYVMLPKKVAWQSLQLWARIDKGAYIEGFWFGPSQVVWRGL